MQSKYAKKLAVLAVIGSVSFTSVGGAFGVSLAAAAEVEGPPAVESIDTGKAVLGGIALFGLVKMFSNHDSGDTSKTVEQSKTQTTTPPKQNQDPVEVTPAPTQAPATLTAMEKQMLDLVNSDRAQNGLSALKWNSKLADVGRAHSLDMVQRDYFAHNAPEGTTPFQRMDSAGISYRAAGENLAYNTSVPSAEQALMNSPGHRANILSSKYSEIGIGIVRKGNGLMISQEFIGK